MPGSDDKSNSNSGVGTSQTLRVKSWPDLNLRKWSEWGFSVREIYRTPRYNFLIQTIQPALKENSGVDPAFVLEGRWYRIDASSERRLEKISWLVYFIVIVLFAFMLSAVLSHSSIVATILFVIMYFLIEGFTLLSLNLVAGSKKAMRVEIPWNSLNRVVLVTDPGVLLLGWSEGVNSHGVAINFHPETAKVILERVKSGLNEEIKVREIDNRTLINPPTDFT